MVPITTIGQMCISNSQTKKNMYINKYLANEDVQKVYEHN